MPEHRPKVVSRRDLFLKLGQIIRPNPEGVSPSVSKLMAFTQQSAPAKNTPATEARQTDRPQTAVIATSKCLAWQGSFCSTCVEHCPIPEAISRTYGKPTVVADLCTGCGICIDRCPAPQNAIQLANRPTHV